MLALLKALLLPPGTPIVLGLVGALIIRRFRRLGTWALVIGGVSGYALSTPIVAAALTRSLEAHDPPTREALLANSPGAIVVLGGGYRDRAPEYGAGPTLNDRTLARVRYAVRLHRQTGLPILASGGSAGDRPAEAALMLDVMKDDFGIAPSSLSAETGSANTWQNAVQSAAMLRARGITRIVLVTSAIHTRRAVDAFKAQGIESTPAPSLFSGAWEGPLAFGSWVPSLTALQDVHLASYEGIGRLWYAIRYDSDHDHDHD